MKVAARIIGAGVLAALAAMAAFLYAYAVGISAGLCGEHGHGWLTAVAVVLPLLVVGSWGLRHGNWILVAWPAAVLSAAACVMLASYLDPGAHGHCETITPYSFSPPLGSRYS